MPADLSFPLWRVTWSSEPVWQACLLLPPAPPPAPPPPQATAPVHDLPRPRLRGLAPVPEAGLQGRPPQRLRPDQGGHREQDLSRLRRPGAVQRGDELLRNLVQRLCCVRSLTELSLCLYWVFDYFQWCWVCQESLRISIWTDSNTCERNQWQN